MDERGLLCIWTITTETCKEVAGGVYANGFCRRGFEFGFIEKVVRVNVEKLLATATRP